MTELATLDAYGVLTEPATLKIQRLLPGPIERVWAYLTESDLRRQWLAAGEMEMKVGAPFELVWRNDELTNPPGQRPAGFPDEHRMQSRITELDPPRKLAITWGGSGDVSFELEPKGNEVLLTVIHRRLPDRANPAEGQRRLAHAPRHSGRPRDRQGAGAVLGRLEPPQAGIRPAAAGLTELRVQAPPGPPGGAPPRAEPSLGRPRQSHRKPPPALNGHRIGWLIGVGPTGPSATTLRSPSHRRRGREHGARIPAWPATDGATQRRHACGRGMSDRMSPSTLPWLVRRHSEGGGGGDLSHT